MSAEELLRAGDIPGALSELQAQIRKDSSSAKLRVFLFQLLAIDGQWSRANTQLNVVKDLDPGMSSMVQTYREVLKCEALRRDVFKGERTPLIFGEPEQWIALLLEALKLSATGEFARSQELRDQAFETAPSVSGTIGDQDFSWIADADPRLGPMLEVIVAGKYWWVPFNRIKNISIDVPSDLRDMVWMPAGFTWANGGQVVGFIPARYPNSETADDSALRLSRRTDWVDQGDDLFFGLGQRIFTTDIGDHALMETRMIDLASEDADDSATPNVSAESASA